MRGPKVEVVVSRLREYLGSPSWYTWHKCCLDLKIKPRTRRLTISQTKLICGWFFLHAQHIQGSDSTRCLSAFYAGAQLGPNRIAPMMSGKDILRLTDRPSNATLYRRGLKHSQCYNAAEVERLLRRSK